MDHVDPINSITLFCVGIVMGLISELANYFSIYSVDAFRSLHADSVALWKEYYELEVQCGSTPEGKIAGRGGRAASAIQAKIQKKTKAMAAFRQRGNIIVGVLFMVSVPLVHSYFDGVPTAYFPFEPLFPLTMFKFAPPSLPGSTQQDVPPMCSAPGMFMLILMMVRTDLQRFFGFATPGGLQKQALNPYAS